MKVALLVDDSKSARIIISRLLKGFNLDVHLADSGETALQMLGTLRPDVIFMDHMMPGLDGFQTMGQIKANPATAQIPVIICTGNEEKGFLEEARGLGAVGVLGKPPTAETIAVALEGAKRILEAPAPLAVEPSAAPVTEAPEPVPEPQPEALAGPGLSTDQVEELVLRQIEGRGLVSVREVRDLIRAIQRDELTKLAQDTLADLLRQHAEGLAADLETRVNRMRKEILESADNTARSEAASAAGAAVAMAMDQQVAERFARQVEEIDARFVKSQGDVTAKAVAAARGEAGNLIAQLAKTVVAQTIDPKLKRAMSDVEAAIAQVQVSLKSVRDEVLGEARGAGRVAAEAVERQRQEFEERIKQLEATFDESVSHLQVHIEDANHSTYETVTRETSQREDKRMLDLRHYLESKFTFFFGIAAAVATVALIAAVVGYFI